MSDLPGFSAFIRDGETVYHTYSTYARGLDMMNVAYQMLDLTALGTTGARTGKPNELGAAARRIRRRLSRPVILASRE